jgi:hypothetical protein
MAGLGNIPMAQLLKAAREATRQVATVVKNVEKGPDYQGNTVVKSGTLTHGQKPSNTTVGLNGQIWYHPDGNLYVCVDSYTANAYYNWKRVQLVNL